MANDGYENSEPPNEESQVEAAVAAGSQVGEAQENEGTGYEDNIDDMELAEALGVPSRIVEKLSPNKIRCSGQVETTAVEVTEPEIELTAQEKRDLRIQQLKSLGPIITFSTCFGTCVTSIPMFQFLLSFSCSLLRSPGSSWRWPKPRKLQSRRLERMEV